MNVRNLSFALGLVTLLLVLAPNAQATQSTVSLAGWLDDVRWSEEKAEVSPDALLLAPEGSGDISYLTSDLAAASLLGAPVRINLGRGRGLGPGRSGRSTGAYFLSALMPGTGHFLFRSRSAMVLGFVHLGIDLVTLSVGAIAYAVYNNDRNNDRALHAFIGAIVVAILHRIECVTEVSIWGRVFDAVHAPMIERKPRLSFYAAPHDTGGEVGAVLSLPF